MRRKKRKRRKKAERQGPMKRAWRQPEKAAPGGKMARLMRVDCIWMEGKDGFFLEAAPAAFGEKAVFFDGFESFGREKADSKCSKFRAAIQEEGCGFATK